MCSLRLFTPVKPCAQRTMCMVMSQKQSLHNNTSAILSGEWRLLHVILYSSQVYYRLYFLRDVGLTNTATVVRLNCSIRHVFMLKRWVICLFRTSSRNIGYTTYMIGRRNIYKYLRHWLSANILKTTFFLKWKWPEVKVRCSLYYSVVEHGCSSRTLGTTYPLPLNRCFGVQDGPFCPDNSNCDGHPHNDLYCFGEIPGNSLPPENEKTVHSQKSLQNAR